MIQVREPLLAYNLDQEAPESWYLQSTRAMGGQDRLPYANRGSPNFPTHKKLADARGVCLHAPFTLVPFPRYRYGNPVGRIYTPQWLGKSIVKMKSIPKSWEQ